MPVVVGSVQSQSGWVPPESTPLDEAAWQSWLEKGRAQDRRRNSLRMKAVKGVSIAALFVAVAFWSQLAPFEVAVRFLVTAGAMVVMFQALQARYYAVAAVFGALAVLYNPVAPVFSFSGEWQRAVVAASAVPFIVSFIWLNVTKVRTAQNA